MNIWQWILVLWPVFKMGISIANETDGKSEVKKDATGKIIATILITIAVELIMWKAGVLKIS